MVGVSWLQANEFCRWRTDRVNEQIMVREGFLVHNPTGQVDDSFFSTEAYLDGQYEEAAKAADGIKDLRPNGVGLPQCGHDRRHPLAGLPPADRGRMGVRRPFP